jgi:uncharacterized protein (DUF2062 family)
MKTGADSYFRRKIINPVLDLLKQGITPEKLSLSVALGITLGIIPLLGIITIVCAFLALHFRLNAAVMIIFSNLVYPIQIALYVPFIRLGEYTFDIPSIPFSLSEVVASIRHDWVEAINRFGLANLLGLFSWAMVAIPLGLGVYYVALYIFRRSKTRKLAH